MVLISKPVKVLLLLPALLATSDRENDLEDSCVCDNEDEEEKTQFRGDSSVCCVGQSSFALPADSASGGLNARGALPFDSSTAFKMERLWGGEKREHLQEPRTTKMKKASTSGPTVKGYFLLCTFFVCASVWVGGGSKVKRVRENVSLRHHTADPRKERAGEKSPGLCWVPSLSASHPPPSSRATRSRAARQLTRSLGLMAGQGQEGWKAKRRYERLT